MVQFSCIVEGGVAHGLQGQPNCGGLLCLMRDCRLDPVSKEEPLEDFTRGSIPFGIGTFLLIDFFFFLEQF